MNDHNKQGPCTADNDHTILLEKYELNQWSQLLGVTQQDLTDAVNKVGNDAEDVIEFLRTNNR